MFELDDVDLGRCSTNKSDKNLPPFLPLVCLTILIPPGVRPLNASTPAQITRDHFDK